jgi:hypothetical protein
MGTFLGSYGIREKRICPSSWTDQFCTAFSHILAMRPNVDSSSVHGRTWQELHYDEEVDRWAAQNTHWAFEGLGMNTKQAKQLEKAGRDWIEETVPEEKGWPVGLC